MSCLYVWFKYDLGQKYYAPQIRPSRGSISWPPDHDRTFHVTETPALTTQPSATASDAIEMEYIKVKANPDPSKSVNMTNYKVSQLRGRWTETSLCLVHDCNMVP